MGKDQFERDRRRFALLWKGQQRGTRGRKATLALTDIVKAGVSIADGEGLEAVSISRVAGLVGAGVMSLYRYVPGKDELVDLMVDTVLGEKEYPDPPPVGWRARLEISARQEWEVYGRHPWVLRAVSTVRLPMGPSMVRDIEWMFRAVDELTTVADTKLYLVMLVMAFVQGAGLLLTAESDAKRKGEGTAQEWWDATHPELCQEFDAVGASTFAAASVELGNPLDLDAWFEFGLERTLDGIAAFAAR